MSIFPDVYEYVEVLNQPENAELKAALLLAVKQGSLFGAVTEEQWDCLVELAVPFAKDWDWKLYAAFIGIACGLLDE